MRRETLAIGTIVVIALLAASLAVAGSRSHTAAGTPTVIAKIQAGRGPCSETGGFGYVWVGVGGDGTLVRIDPATNAVTATVDVGPGPCGVAIGAGSVWVDGYASQSVIRVNPTTLKVVKTIKLPDQIWDVTFGANSVSRNGMPPSNAGSSR